MTDAKRGPIFASARDIFAHAVVATKYLEEVTSDCADGDKGASR